MEKSLDYKGRWRNHTVAFRVEGDGNGTAETVAGYAYWKGRLAA